MALLIGETRRDCTALRLLIAAAAVWRSCVADSCCSNQCGQPQSWQICGNPTTFACKPSSWTQPYFCGNCCWLACSPGWYCTASDAQGTHKVCPSGTYSLSGSAACSACPSGNYSGPESGTCCSLGAWSAPRETTCTQCSAGTYSATPGANSAAACLRCTCLLYTSDAADE